MPNKYEREIEEILRNLERSEPREKLGQKWGGRMRRKPEQRRNARGLRFPSLTFGATEWFLIIAWAAALIAGGLAFAHKEADIITGSIALVGAVCLALVIILPFIERSRYSRPPSRYGNVTPLRRNPFHGLATRWNLFLLKLRSRRRRDH